MAVELATAYVSVIPTVKGIDKAARDSAKGVGKGIDQELDKGLRGVGQKHGSRIGSAITSAAAKAAKVGAAAAGIAVGATFVGGFRSAIAQENTEKTLGGLYDSTAKAGDMMERIRGIAKKSPIEFDAYSKGATAIAYMGIEGEKSEKILRNIGDAITTAGGGGEEMGRATDALTKMTNAGKVQLDTLNMLSEAGVPIFSGLSEHFGKSISEVREMVTAGQVGIEDVLSVTENATGPIFKQMQKASKSTATSFSNQWKIAKDNVMVAVGDRMRPAIESLGPVVGKVGTRVAELISGDGGGKMPAWITSIKEGVGTLKGQAGQVFTKDILPHLKRFWGDMKGVFADVKPFANSVGSFLSDAFKAFQPYLKTAAKLLGGAFTLALRAIPPVLSGVMKALGWVLDKLRPLLPLVAAVVSAFVAYKTALLVINGVQKVAAAVTTAYHAVMSAGPAIMYAVGAAQRFYTATVNGGTGAVKARTLAEKIGLVVGKAKIIATKAMAAAQWLLNAAMTANPIGLVIAGLVALVAGMVIAYKKSETFRRIVDAAWAGIKKAAKATVDWFRDTAWPALKSVFTGIGSAAMWLWNKGIRPAFNAIGAVFRSVAKVAAWLWGKLKAAFDRINHGARLVGAGFKALYNAYIRPATKWIADRVSWVWGKIKTAFDRIQRGARLVGSGFKSLYNSGIKPATKWIADRASWLWGKVKNAFDKIKGGANSVKTGIERTAKGIRTAWGKLNGYIREPIKKAISWMNRKFIGGLNKLLDTKVLSIPKSWRIPTIKGFRTGGWTGRGPADEAAGIVHKDEFVVKKPSRKKFERENPGALDYINRFGKLPGYRIGGKVAGLNKRFLDQLHAFNAAAGGRYSVYSGYRSNAHQAQLYARYLAGRGPVAAKPGSSMHNRGLAADLAPSNARDVHGGLARSMGLVFTVPSESWHIEPSWGRGSNAGPSSGGGGGGWGLPSWLSNPVKHIKDKMSGAFDGFKKKASSYGVAGAVLPSMMTKLRESVTSRIKKAADSLLSFGDGGGGGGINFAGIQGGTNKILGKGMAERYGWTGHQWNALSRLWDKESNWNHKARNPSSGAYGIPQSLPASKMRSAGADYLTNAKTQIAWGLKYIKDRYGNPAAALAFHNRRNWYGDGGRVSPLEFDNGGYLPTGRTIVENNTGKPEPLKRIDLKDEATPAAVTVYVQNPWTGEYHEARMQDIVLEREDFNNSVERGLRR